VSVDLKLVAAQVAKGDAAAFRSIVEHTKGPLYRLATRIVGDLAEAEDALQDGYLKAFRALSAGKYDGRSSVRTWLYRIVSNACIDALRKRRELPTGDKREPRFDGAVSAEARLALRQLDTWLQELPPQQRAAFVLRKIEGKTAKEVAAILDCSQGAVEQRLGRARATLQKRYREEDANDEA